LVEQSGSHFFKALLLFFGHIIRGFGLFSRISWRSVAISGVAATGWLH
jgi:hypothetical protein